MSMNVERLKEAAQISRGLSMDAVAKAKSGHLGLPLGAAEIGAVLFGHALSYNPEQPRWINRDRFVLSAGHGSMFLYSWLHLAGYKLSLEDLKAFRQMHSKTPGHPEYGETDGVECTTGPLGQGVANAVGMAVSGKMAQAHFNHADHVIFDYHVVCLAGDGCLQEGVSAEAASFAGHNKLDNLILIYDSNDVTLDAAASKTQSEDAALRFQAYGFEVQQVDGHDMASFLDAFQKAKSNTGKPQLIIAKTEIGRGIPEVAGSYKAHGEAGVAFVTEARRAMGLPEESFYVSDSVKDYFGLHRAKLESHYMDWLERYKAWKEAFSEKAAHLESAHKRLSVELLSKAIPEFSVTESIATRQAGGVVLNALAKADPLIISGSADLHGSTKNYIKDGGDFSATHSLGRNLYWGIREHAMGAMLNGFAYENLFHPSGATFLTFSDYMRPSIRLAALSKLPVTYIFTHDSVGVGEDGPTHQPVETVSSLRLIPNLHVIRPADPEETAGAFICAFNREDGPTAIILTRQGLPVLDSVPPSLKREGVHKGAYIVHKEVGSLSLILISTGSELQWALQAAKSLGPGVRVVSIPCFERFNAQDKDYQESILPSSCTRRVAIEAGVSGLWHAYVGTEGKVIGIDRFGLSAPGKAVMTALDMTSEAVLKAAQY